MSRFGSKKGGSRAAAAAAESDFSTEDTKSFSSSSTSSTRGLAMRDYDKNNASDDSSTTRSSASSSSPPASRAKNGSKSNSTKSKRSKEVDADALDLGSDDLMFSSASSASSPLLLFSTAHSPPLTLQSGLASFVAAFKPLYRLKSSAAELTSSLLENAAVLVLMAPSLALSEKEQQAVSEWVEKGGSLLCMAAEGSASSSPSTASSPHDHLNALLARYGLQFQNDSLVNLAYTSGSGCFHPKECFVRGATVESSMEQVKVGRSSSSAASLTEAEDAQAFELELNGPRSSLDLLYPFGCSLQFSAPTSGADQPVTSSPSHALPLLSSGNLTFPAHRCLCAYTECGKGRVVALGSYQWLEDLYFGKADNSSIAVNLFHLLASSASSSSSAASSIASRLRSSPKDRPEFSKPLSLPDSSSLSARLRSCLQEADELTGAHGDFSTLFDTHLFGLTPSLVSAACDLFPALNVKKTPLSLIPPTFDTAVPLMQAAIFAPAWRSPAAPPLELCDLDESFSDRATKLAQVSNKMSGSSKELEAYVLEVARILDIEKEIRTHPAASSSSSTVPLPPTANQVLTHVLRKLLDFKRIEQESLLEKSERMHASSSSSAANRHQLELMKVIGGHGGASNRAGGNVMSFDS